MTTFFIIALSIMALIVFWPYVYDYYISRSPIERQADHAEHKWRQEMREEGVPAEEMEVRAQVRRALASIQDAASKAVYSNNGDIDEQINEIAMIHIMSLGDKSIYGRALINVLKETPKEELLYPDALHELARQYKSKERARPADWKPVRNVPRKMTDEERKHQAWISLNAFTTRH